ncbi:hypothetical protein [Paenibacillus apiarius]|uniref:hypothetical protein n=1 Tax=Paenibacillus apiarius TaxID=46240 RepID=UPI00197D2F3E|nr:hypothetical protein [Paenibacillus apiarius]MBN3526955.1 hypothetical protein [Paenibacillus apiarius]
MLWRPHFPYWTYNSQRCVPYYFRKVAAYYEAMVKNFPSYSFYWYYLADAQAKAGMTDSVFLTGNKPFGEGSPFIDHIALFVQEGHTKNVTKLPLAETAGYNPTIFLGDFTGDKTDDICIVIDAGGSGGIIYANLFSYWNWKYHLIFDSETFNATKGNYDVVYKDNYKVEVINRQLHTKYTIDIAYKGADYLASIYDQGGKLIKPMTDEVGNIGGLYPIDYERDGIYDLTAAQNIMGQYQADRLGIVNTVLYWNGMAFIPIRQYVQIYGSKLQS